MDKTRTQYGHNSDILESPPRADMTTDNETLLTAIDTMPPRERALMGLMAFAGLRTAEIAALRRKDIQTGQEPSVYVERGRGGISRRVPLEPRAQAFLRQYLESIHELSPDAPLFAGHGATSISSRGIQHVIRRTTNRMPGGPLTARELRLMCIRRWQEAGLPVPEMRRRLGVVGLGFLEPLDAEVKNRRKMSEKSVARRRRPGRPRVNQARDVELRRMVDSGLSYAQAARQYTHQHELATALTPEAVRKAVTRLSSPGGIV